MNFGGCERERAARVRDLNPSAVELVWPLCFGDDAESALLHNIRRETVTVHLLAAYRNKEPARAGLTRVVRNICDRRGLVCARQTPADCARDFAERDRRNF